MFNAGKQLRCFYLKINLIHKDFKMPLKRIFTLMKQLITIACILLMAACKEQAYNEHGSLVIGHGQMPNISTGPSNALYVVYGTGDSIMISSSADGGNSFGAPAAAVVLSDLAASHSRGPQLTATAKGLCMIACNNAGDIFSWHTDSTGKWSGATKVNDVDTVAKEGFTALSADGNNVFAVWLDLRDKHNKIYGAKSADGGKSWSANELIYASPDTTVYECCKPSVAVKGNHVYVMFRNWLDGKRDMYLIQSADGGKHFGQATKLGAGSWKLDGCPVDGAVAVRDDGKVETVWRRGREIFSCRPGEAEQMIGEGRSCTMATTHGKNIYAWVEQGEVVCLLPNGKKEVLGKGKLPLVKAVDHQKAICIWEHEKQIHSKVLSL